ncbi:TniQ family protein [Cytobacillus solani]|uniref:TniQ family protein n=1 Tax=Cytobacillus solani TaxID=1637975 RepID=UPI0011548816|nr:TniQ family protein [Cytobacillus solani]
MVQETNRSTRLLLLAPPYTYESFEGYILRLTHENNYDSSVWIYQLIKQVGKNKYTTKQSSLNEKINSLSMIGLKHEEIQILNWGLEYDNVVSTFYRQSFKCKICPLCLNENGYYSELWNYLFVTSCPKHKCLLVVNCQKCDRYLTWSRGHLFKCGCGFDIRKSKIINSNEANNEFSSLVSTKLYNNAIFTNEVNPLYNINNENIFRLINFFAMRVFRNGKSIRKLPLTKMENEEIDRIVSDVFNIFTDWPNNYFLFLDSIENDVKKGVVRKFGSFYRNILENYNDFPFLLDAFKYYLILNKSKYISVNYLKLINQDKSLRTDLTGTQAAEFLGMKVTTIKKLLKNGVLKGIEKRISSKHNMSLIDIDSIMVLKEKLKSWYSVNKTKEILNLSETLLYDFLELLEFIEVPQKNGAVRRYFNPDSVNGLLKQIDSMIIYSQNEKLLSLDYSVKLLNSITKSYSYLDIIKDILNKNLIPRGKESSIVGIRSYLLKEYEVLNFGHRELKRQNKDTYSVKETATLINFKSSDMWSLFNRGFIKKVDNSKSARIHKEEIERFNKTYIDLKNIKKQYDFPFEPTLNNLQKRGIQPVMGPKYDGGRKYLFLKESIEGLAKVK